VAVVMILLATGLAALAVLLGCLKGFSQALRHKKVSGVFVTPEEDRRKASRRGPSKTLVDFSRRKPRREGISGRTVALMSLVIALGAHGIPGETQSSSFRGEKTRVPGVQPLHKS
jgi:hypothetical protein